MLALELFVQGLVQGSIYALIAVGLTLVYGLLLLTFGGYLGVLVTNGTGSLTLALLAAMLVVGRRRHGDLPTVLSADPRSAAVRRSGRLARADAQDDRRLLRSAPPPQGRRLLVEQSTARALALADRVYVPESGRAVWQRPAAEAREDPAMIDAYLGLQETGSSRPSA